MSKRQSQIAYDFLDSLDFQMPDLDQVAKFVARVEHNIIEKALAIAEEDCGGCGHIWTGINALLEDNDE